jgi:excisionase family DNA binding protein
MGRREATVMERMLTAREVADTLGVHENWVYDRAASGELPSYKLGGNRRFRPSEVEEWVKESLKARRPSTAGVSRH